MVASVSLARYTYKNQAKSLAINQPGESAVSSVISYDLQQKGVVRKKGGTHTAPPKTITSSRTNELSNLTNQTYEPHEPHEPHEPTNLSNLRTFRTHEPTNPRTHEA